MKKTPYDDIINLPHHVSRNHPQMPMRDRAAQFAPFAALTGYDNAVAETGRLTEQKRELDAQELTELNRRFALLILRLQEQQEVCIEYFVPDELKAGGAYHVVHGTVLKFSAANRHIVMVDGLVIPMNEIVSLNGAFFDSTE